MSVDEGMPVSSDRVRRRAGRAAGDFWQTTLRQLSPQGREQILRECRGHRETWRGDVAEQTNVPRSQDPNDRVRAFRDGEIDVDAGPAAADGGGVDG